MKRTKFTPAYRRWKEQLEAMKSGEFEKVRKLAKDARDSLTLKETGTLQLSF